MISQKEAFIEQMKSRTKQLAIDTIKHVNSIPRTEEAGIIKNQIIRSVTSVAANYRAVCRARSRNEFYAKLSISIEEADETSFWFELLVESDISRNETTFLLLKESNEIVMILASARKSMR